MRRRLVTLVDAAWRAPKTFLTVMAGLTALAISGLVFLGASEDVIRRNGAATLDAARLDWVTDHRSHALIAVAKFLNAAGSVGVVAALALALGLLLWRRGLPLVVAGTPLVAVVAAEGAAAFLKVLVDRARPASALRLVTETDPSFPSGHATAAMAFGIGVAAVLIIFVLRSPWSRLVALTLGVLLPTLIGASRLELGVHWPTDVVAGLALGASVALVISGMAAWLVANEPGSSSSKQGQTAALRSRAGVVLRRHRESGRLLVAPQDDFNATLSVSAP